MRRFLNQQSLEWLQSETERLDPEYFLVVDKKNPARLKRGLEVLFTTGKKYSEQRIGKKVERPFQLIKVGISLPREVLNERINNRVEAMLKQGLLEEVKGLYLHKKLNALNTVGYEEIFDFIDDKISWEETVALTKQNTRQYAKRQMTWFRKDDSYTWFQPQHTANIFQFIEEQRAKE